MRTDQLLKEAKRTLVEVNERFGWQGDEDDQRGHFDVPAAVRVEVAEHQHGLAVGDVVDGAGHRGDLEGGARTLSGRPRLRMRD